ncbi:hypothetical protein AVEN_162393-1 [Araneus ventricosus]|uniref:Uncharacterized protein n=1 Tax=Araneus ventricosus TaxID=182803 RepID=A0A4Y2GH23_ARAVE|nr:hypothetical protein AVEN_162393-1 [Araneus ventricosus]
MPLQRHGQLVQQLELRKLWNARAVVQSVFQYKQLTRCGASAIEDLKISERAKLRMNAQVLPDHQVEEEITEVLTKS